MEIKYKLINRHSGADLFHTNDVIADFLVEHLQEYGDKKEHVLKALDYVFSDCGGGHILLGLDDKDIVGAVILNETGMEGYIPENILVYIAVHKDYRGKGLGKLLMQQAIKVTKGGIALHVEPENPAVHLYKKMGFTNKYLEMRYSRS